MNKRTTYVAMDTQKKNTKSQYIILAMSRLSSLPSGTLPVTLRKCKKIIEHCDLTKVVPYQPAVLRLD